MVVKDINGFYADLFEEANKILPSNEDGTKVVNNLNDYFMNLKNLADKNAKFLILPIDEETFDINANTREIIIPKSFSSGVGVQGDEIAEIIYFTIDRYYDITDLSKKEIVIQWQNGQAKGVSKAFNQAIMGPVGAEKIVFGWPISSEMTATPGKILFSIKFYSKDDETGDITYNFNTLSAAVKINASLPYEDFAEKPIIDREDKILDNIKGYLQ